MAWQQEWESEKSFSQKCKRNYFSSKGKKTILIVYFQITYFYIIVFGRFPLRIRGETKLVLLIIFIYYYYIVNTQFNKLNCLILGTSQFLLRTPASSENIIMFKSDQKSSTLALF